MVGSHVVGGHVAIGGVLRRACRPGVLEVLADQTIGIIANAEPLIAAEVPVYFPQINIIVQRVAIRCEILLERLRRLLGKRIGGHRYLEENRIGCSVALPVVIEEEKHLVFDYRAADVAPKLIEMIGALGNPTAVVLPLIGIESLVPEELERS